MYDPLAKDKEHTEGYSPYIVSINVFIGHGVNADHNPYRIKGQQPHDPHKIMLRVYRTTMLVLLSL